MVIVLENDILRAQIKSRGAELISLRCGGTERIWCGDPAVWERQSPVLFPFIGRLMNEQYELNGQLIHAEIHGFCRDAEFTAQQVSPVCARFTLTQSEETRKVFPFDFRFEIEYELAGDTLYKRHTVTNLSDAVMPFEIGGHEAYSTEILPGETAADYAVRFYGTDAVEPFGMEEGSGMLTLPKSRIPLQDGLLTKLPGDVGLDTIVLEGLPQRRAMLIGLKSGLGTEVCFDDFPYLGVWTMTAENARYICIEPWTALPDGHFVTRNIFERPGILTLQPGCSGTWSYTQRYF